MKRILILSSAESQENRQALTIFKDSVAHVMGEGYELQTRHYNDIRIDASEQGLQVIDLVSGEQLSTYDLVYFKSYYRYVEVAVTVAEYLRANSVEYVCSELESYISFSKLSQYARLAVESFPIPQTVYFVSTVLVEKYDELINSLGAPFICKAIDGKGGDLNFLVNDKQQFESILSDNPGLEFICQRFVANSYDLRVLVVGKEVKLIIERRRTSDDSHLNNTSKGANSRLVDSTELESSVLDMSVRAAMLFKREIAGVDVMFRDGDAKPFILEVNASPQVSTGAFTDEKIAVYANFLKR